MPQRLLRPSIRQSKIWNTLSWFEQTFYIRLITLVDDYGRYEAEPRLLASEAFPYGDPIGQNVDLPTIDSSLRTFVSKNLMLHYQVEDKRYLELLKWKERARSESKFPHPNKGVLLTFAGNCWQMFASPPSPSPSPSPAPVRAQMLETEPAAQPEAVIPTWQEVKAEADLRAVPEASAKRFFDHHENQRLWLNKYGQLINWRPKLISWAADDRQPNARTPNRNQAPDRNAGTFNEPTGKYGKLGNVG